MVFKKLPPLDEDTKGKLNQLQVRVDTILKKLDETRMQPISQTDGSTIAPLMHDKKLWEDFKKAEKELNRFWKSLFDD